MESHVQLFGILQGVNLTVHPTIYVNKNYFLYTQTPPQGQYFRPDLLLKSLELFITRLKPTNSFILRGGSGQLLLPAPSWQRCLALLLLEYVVSHEILLKDFACLEEVVVRLLYVTLLLNEQCNLRLLRHLLFLNFVFSVFFRQTFVLSIKKN